METLGERWSSQKVLHPIVIRLYLRQPNPVMLGYYIKRMFKTFAVAGMLLIYWGIKKIIALDIPELCKGDEC